MTLSKELLHELFDYRDGALYWRVRPHKRSRARAGDRAGCAATPDGRIVIGYNKTQYLAHRLIFAWHFGHTPALLDHINGNRSDNRIENLRPASVAQNTQNSKLARSNASGAKNVSWNTRLGKWVVQVVANGKHFWLGMYDDLELAALVAEMGREKYHKEFARHA